MNRKGVSLAACLALVALLAVSSGVAAQSGAGYVTYKIEAVTPSGQQSVVINETVGPSAKAGFSDLVLQMIGGQQNLTYSRFVNSSTDFLPYLSTLTSQALSYTNGTASSIRLNVTATGTETVTFQGSRYSLSVYSFAVSGSYGNRSLSANGTLATFPSSLVYSASVSAGNASAQALLLASDLQLTQPSHTSTAVVAGVGAGIGAAALTVALVIRRRDEKSQDAGEKPLHWVD